MWIQTDLKYINKKSGVYFLRNWPWCDCLHQQLCYSSLQTSPFCMGRLLEFPLSPQPEPLLSPCALVRNLFQVSLPKKRQTAEQVLCTEKNTCFFDKKCFLLSWSDGITSDLSYTCTKQHSSGRITKLRHSTLRYCAFLFTWLFQTITVNTPSKVSSQ